jgi:tetratricopeptide (TPR) repeat protein
MIPMKRFGIILAAALAAGLLAGPSWAQEKKDTVILRSRVVVSGYVLKEDWKTVEIDKSGSGRAEVSYPTDQVDRVEYGNRPRYLLDAKLLKTTKPKDYIATLSRAYSDDSTKPFILQHAYHDIAVAYEEMARTDPSMLPKAIEAYEQLFKRVPDTRYSITGRTDLGNMLLAQGKVDEAIRVFQELGNGTFGPKVAQDGKMMIARAELMNKRYEDAEKLLTQLSAGVKMQETELSQQLKLLRCRSLVGQKKLDEAYRGIDEVFAEKPSQKNLGTAYCVLGDVLAARGNYKAALESYLKVPLMYPDADAPEKAQAVKQAVAMLEKLGRAKEAGSVKKLVGGE